MVDFPQVAGGGGEGEGLIILFKVGAQFRDARTVY